MKGVSTERRHRILAQSLTFTVLLSDGSSSPKELERLKTWHGPNGMGISLPMFQHWRDAFLTLLPQFDSEVTDELKQVWQTATTALLQQFQPPKH